MQCFCMFDVVTVATFRLRPTSGVTVAVTVVDHLLAFAANISLPCVSFVVVPGLSCEVLSHGGGGLGSLNCVQEDIDLRLDEAFAIEGI